MIRVLVVDDSALMRKLFGNVFAGESDLEVRFAKNGVEALEQLEAFHPHVITLDVQMPGMNGLECLDRIMVVRPSPVVMVSTLTGAGAATTLEAMRLGAVDFVAKPGGAVSLRMAEFAPTLVEKVRTAATAKIRASQRLRERVRHRIGGLTPSRRAPAGTGGLESLQGRAGTAAESTGTGDSADSAGSTRAAGAAVGEGLVLIGISTGGPPALETLLSALPASFPWPIVIAQDMPASFTGALANRLDGICEIRVQEVTAPVILKPGCAYIGRGDSDVIVSRRPGGLVAMNSPLQLGYPWHPSADRLVRSAMGLVAADRLIGVLMTGMGNDGAEAMTLLRAAGGRTIAEAEETAVVWGMPGELVKAGGADFVVPLHGIAEKLQQLTPRHAARS